MGTYTRLDDAKVESCDKALLVLGRVSFVTGEQLARVLETNGHSIGVGGLSEPPAMSISTWSNHQEWCTIKAEKKHLQEVINLVLLGRTVRDLVGVRIDIVGIDTVTSLVLGSLDPGSHGDLDTGDTRRGFDVEPPFRPVSHLVFGGFAFSSCLVEWLAFTTVTCWVESESVGPEMSVSCTVEKDALGY